MLHALKKPPGKKVSSRGSLKNPTEKNKDLRNSNDNF